MCTLGELQRFSSPNFTTPRPSFLFPHNPPPGCVQTHVQVGAYAGLIKERFERCLDLYLCPRAFKRRLNIDPESLVPRLPRPRELKPFPNALCLEYDGHLARVRCVACSGDGQWLATGDDDGMLILWEVGSVLGRWGGGGGGRIAEKNIFLGPTLVCFLYFIFCI